MSGFCHKLLKERWDRREGKEWEGKAGKEWERKGRQ